MPSNEPFPLDQLDPDWIKRGSLDLPAKNPEELRAWLKAKGMTVEQFKRLDVYRANRDRTWLADL